jgi:hypothetical protein
MAGDDTHPSRFAFIEFATIEAAVNAMAINGVQLADKYVLSSWCFLNFYLFFLLSTCSFVHLDSHFTPPWWVLTDTTNNIM